MKKIKSIIAVILAVVLLFSALPVQAFAAELARLIHLGVTTVTITEPGTRALLHFRPEESGRYALTSYADEDTRAYLYANDMELLQEDDDSGEGSNFCLLYDLEAGKDYYYGVQFYDYSTNGSFDVELTKKKAAKSIDIVTLPNKTEYIEGFVDNNIDVTGLELKITWEDDSTDIWQYTNENPYYDGLELGKGYYYDDETSQAKIFLWYGDLSTNFDITLIDNPVESVEIINNGMPDLVENTNGEIGIYENPETGESEEFFRYYYSDYYSYLNLKINYNDGRDSDLVPLTEWQFYGYQITMEDSQYQKPWTKGADDNTIYVSYLGAEDSINVTIGDSPIAGIEVTETEDATVFENTDGYWDVSNSGEEFYYYDIYSYYKFLVKFNMTITYNDGREPLTQNLWELCSSGGASLYTSQYDTPWVIGGENNTVTFEYMGAKTTYNVKIKKNPIESIEVIDNGAPAIFENTNGYWEQRENYETGEYEDFYFYSDLDSVFRKLQIKVTYNDGREPEYKGLYNDDDDGIDLTYSMDQYASPWVLGGQNNTVTFNYLGKTADYNVEIIKNPIESIEIIDNGFPTLIEEENGYWRYGDEPFFYYYYGEHLENLSLKINYNDGREPYIQALGITEILGNYVSDYSNQDEQPWTVGGTENTITFEYMEMQATYNVKIQKSAVEKIEIIDNGFPALYENASGYWAVRWNDETQQEESYFEYNYYEQLNNLSLKVTYNDGRAPLVEKIEYDGYNDETLVNGIGVLTTSDQINKPWTIGAEDNLITFRYLGAETTYNAKIAQNPVEKIEIIENGNPALYENGSGYWSTRYDEDLLEEVDFYCYHLEYLFDNLSIKVTYNDGRAPVIKQFGTDYDTIIDGYYINYYSQQHEDPWVKGGENNTIFFEYLGAECEYNVKIVDNPVDRIEIIDNGFPEFLVETNGWWEESGYTGGYYYFYNYYDYLDKLTVKIYYNDGRDPATIKLNKIYDEQIPVDGYLVDYSDRQYANPWGVDGENTVTFTYLGAQATYDVKIKEGNVTGIEILNGPTKNTYFTEQVLPNYIGMKFKVTTADGSQEITVSEQNIRYTRYESTAVNVLIGDNYATIKTEDGVTTISYLGMQATAKGLITYGDAYVTNVKVNSFNTSGVMEMEFTFNDGSKEYVTTTVLKQHGLEEYGYGVGGYGYFDQYYIAQTDLGIIYYNLFQERQGGSYSLYIFGGRFILKDTQLSGNPGDVDDSGEVTLDDVVALAQVVAGWQGVNHNASALDTNKDGSVTLDDVVLLAQYVAGWNVTLK